MLDVVVIPVKEYINLRSKDVVIRIVNPQPLEQIAGRHINGGHVIVTYLGAVYLKDDVRGIGGFVCRGNSIGITPAELNVPEFNGYARFQINVLHVVGVGDFVGIFFNRNFGRARYVPAYVLQGNIDFIGGPGSLQVAGSAALAARITQAANLFGIKLRFLAQVQGNPVRPAFGDKAGQFGIVRMAVFCGGAAAVTPPFGADSVHGPGRAALRGGFRFQLAAGMGNKGLCYGELILGNIIVRRGYPAAVFSVGDNAKIGSVVFHAASAKHQDSGCCQNQKHPKAYLHNSS